MNTQENDQQRVDEWINEARQTMNRSRLLIWSFRSIAVTSAALVIAFGAVVISGHAVPAWTLFVGLGVAVTLASAGVLFTRANTNDATSFLDERCALRDGVKTAASYSKQDGPFIRKQRQWTAAQLSSVDRDSLKLQTPRKLLAAGILLPLLVGTLALSPESSAVREARAEDERTLELASELQEGLREEVERVIDETPEHAREHLDADALKEHAQELSLTPDREELLKQFSSMERDIANRADALSDARRQRLIDLLSNALQTSPETKRVGDSLRSGNLQEAAAQLAEFSANDLKATPENLAEIKDKLERLSKLATRMGEVARKAEQSAADASEKNLDEWSKNVLNDALELEKTTEDALKSMGDCQSGTCTNPELSALASANKRGEDALKKLSRSLRKEDGRRRAKSSLEGLRNTLAQCQSAVAGQTTSPFSGPGAGNGSVLAQNLDETPSGGQITKLSGQQNDGPSRSRLLDAASGSGQATMTRTEHSEEYSRQLESFVRRADVPWELKEGVKTYFETLNKPTPPQHDAPTENEGSKRD